MVREILFPVGEMSIKKEFLLFEYTVSSFIDFARLIVKIFVCIKRKTKNTVVTQRSKRLFDGELSRVFSKHNICI